MRLGLRLAEDQLVTDPVPIEPGEEVRLVIQAGARRSYLRR